MAETIKRDFRQAGLTTRELALCEFAEKLTLSPAKMTREDCDALRAVGLTDRDILDAVEVISYFNYINRVADALGIDPEPEMLKK
ncbi:MAG: peroxidase-related enzyme [Acidobacteria bacterium]|nr:peroxidase-related enzyme [Acidobacteriota bacterium]